MKSPESTAAGRPGKTPTYGELVRWFCMIWARREREIQRQSGQAAHFDLLAWGRRYLPGHFSRPPNDMHRWLAQQLATLHTARGTKINLLGPRGNAKSTLGTLAYPLWAALEEWEPYIWIVSDTMHQARAHLENIKSELTDNPLLAAAYPEAAAAGPVWRSGTIVLRTGVTIEAYGTGQRIRGRRRRAHRPTLIVCDDLQNDGHMQSALQRDHSRNWFHGTLLKAGTVRTNVVNLATALHREALAMELSGNPGWTSRTFQAIQSWPANMPLWQEWETLYTDLARPDYQQAARRFYQEHHAEMDAGAVVLWPEEEDLYTLMYRPIRPLLV